MTKLKIEGSQNTPQINFDTSSGEFWIEGNSYFNNSVNFYLGIIDWLNKQKFKNDLQAKVHIALDYFDSSSKKGIVELLKAFINKYGKSSLDVSWHYKSDDIDTKSIGEEFSLFFEMDFEFVSSF